MPEVVAMGEALSEVMRKRPGVSLGEPEDFVGPFPSGAPAIFADQVARLGHSVAFVGAVGYDAFGEALVGRLGGDGVDVAGVERVPGLATGVAFVTYRADGSREFIFHLGNAAAGRMPALGETHLAGASWLHVCGSTLAASKQMRERCHAAVELAAAWGCQVSFDPNLRPELLGGGRDEFRGLCEPVLGRAALVLPGREELAALTGRTDPMDGARALLDRGVGLVAVKLGAEGCALYGADGCVREPGFEVGVVDPTGAGDCFDAGVVCGLLEGLALEEVARLANACGALGATRQGPMEGARPRCEVEQLLRTQ